MINLKRKMILSDLSHFVFSLYNCLILNGRKGYIDFSFQSSLLFYGDSYNFWTNLIYIDVAKLCFILKCILFFLNILRRNYSKILGRLDVLLNQYCFSFWEGQLIGYISHLHPKIVLLKFSDKTIDLGLCNFGLTYVVTKEG